VKELQDHWDEAYELGQRNMLATCIKVLSEAFEQRLTKWRPLSGYHQIDIVAHDKWLVLRELQALQEKP
jgi:hypothetical protein